MTRANKNSYVNTFTLIRDFAREIYISNFLNNPLSKAEWIYKGKITPPVSCFLYYFLNICC